MRPIAPLLASLLLALAVLAGCGKKGTPSVPGPQSEVIYPKQYPAPDR